MNKTILIIALIALAVAAGLSFASDEVLPSITFKVDQAPYIQTRTINTKFDMDATQAQADGGTILLAAGVTTRLSEVTFPVGWSWWKNITTGSVVKVGVSADAGTNLTCFMDLEFENPALFPMCTNAVLYLYGYPVQAADATIGTNAALEKLWVVK